MGKERPGCNLYPNLTSAISRVTLINLPLPFPSRKRESPMLLKGWLKWMLMPVLLIPWYIKKERKRETQLACLFHGLWKSEEVYHKENCKDSDKLGPTWERKYGTVVSRCLGKKLVYIHPFSSRHIPLCMCWHWLRSSCSLAHIGMFFF